MKDNRSQLSKLAITGIVLAGASLLSAQSATAAPFSGFSEIGSASSVRSTLLGLGGAHAKSGEEGKCGEGKCGEGKCGSDGDKDGSEGKCGEGKCGS